jgi:hypothetical protein
LAVEKLVENTLEGDPIEKIDKLAHVMGHLSRVITPRASHERIPLHVSLNTSAQASRASYGRGGRGGNANPEVVVHDDRHHHEEVFFTSFSAHGENAGLIESLGIESSSTDSPLSIIAIDPFQFQI